MGEALAAVGICAMVIYLLWGKVSKETVTEVVTSAQIGFIKADDASALGVAPELVVSQMVSLLKYGIDPVIKAAFPVDEVITLRMRVIPLTDRNLVAWSVKLNPELARVAAIR